MNRFRLIVLGADIVGILIISLFSVAPAQAKQCSTERPPNARSYWSYRLIDGRKCWYEGKPMLSKSLLHWPTSRTAQAASRERNVTPANQYNLLDAQASMPFSPATKPKPEVRQDMVDASPTPTSKRTLTPDHLHSWANSMAAMTAEPILTIMDRWPDEELPQPRNKATPIEAPSVVTPRSILMVAIMFMAMLAVLIHVTFYRRPLQGT
jgi:hypothetical protein